MNVKQSLGDSGLAVPLIAPAQALEIMKDASKGAAVRDLPAIDLSRRARHGGWLVRLAGMPRRALSALLRPRPDLRALSPHMRRDVGLVDTMPVKKHR